MQGFKHIDKIRQYCYYIEEHLFNVKESWNIIQEKCKDFNFIYDDFLFNYINENILNHDLSKFSIEEFIPYQQKFFPVSSDKKNIKENFAKAWENHQSENPHHWQNWTKNKEEFPNQNVCFCVEMVVDWMAVGMVFGDTAEEYYTKNKKSIHLPSWADKLILEMFDKIYSSKLSPEDKSKEQEYIIKSQKETIKILQKANLLLEESCVIYKKLLQNE